MQYPIIVRTEPSDEYSAQPLGLPELEARARTEAEAVDLVRRALQQWLSTARLVQVEIPMPGPSNPWLDTFGRSASDPDFEEFQEELRRIRSEANAS